MAIVRLTASEEQCTLHSAEHDPQNTPDPSTFYGACPHGHIDYPALDGFFG